MADENGGAELCYIYNAITRSLINSSPYHHISGRGEIVRVGPILKL